MFCSKCGNELTEGSAFCNRCGNPVNPQYAGSTQPIQENPVSDAGAAENLSEGTVPAKKKKKSKVIIPVIAVLLVAVIGIAAFATGGFGLLGDSDTESSSNTETSYGTEESSTNKEADSSEEAEDIKLDEISVDSKDTVEEYTWEELSAISSKIAKASDEDEAIEIAKTYNLVNEDGTLDGTQTKRVTLADGTVTSVQIIGFLHDDKSDGSGKAGITFIFADAIAMSSMNSDSDNTGGWESSDMRTALASYGKTLLPEELRDVIVAVDKSTNNAGYVENPDDVSVVTTTSDELWLFSLVEFVGELDESTNPDVAAVINAEGSQYKLFSDCGIDWITDDILARGYQGESCTWWLRTPGLKASDGFMFVCDHGYPYYGSYANSSQAVVPGFCI